MLHFCLIYLPNRLQALSVCCLMLRQTRKQPVSWWIHHQWALTAYFSFDHVIWISKISGVWMPWPPKTQISASKKGVVAVCKKKKGSLTKFCPTSQQRNAVALLQTQLHYSVRRTARICTSLYNASWKLCEAMAHMLVCTLGTLKCCRRMVTIRMTCK